MRSKDIKSTRKPTACDIESIAGETACIGFANDPHYSVCINFQGSKIQSLPVSEEADILYAIQDMCDSHRDQNVPMIGQNAQFDTYCAASQELSERQFLRRYHATTPYALPTAPTQPRVPDESVHHPPILQGRDLNMEGGGRHQQLLEVQR